MKHKLFSLFAIIFTVLAVAFLVITIRQHLPQNETPVLTEDGTAIFDSVAWGNSLDSVDVPIAPATTTTASDFEEASSSTETVSAFDSHTDSTLESSAESSVEQSAAQSNETNEADEPAKSSPVDFEALQKINPDAYAWLYIPDTNISYPILQHSSDDEYYLSHDYRGASNDKGAIFSQKTYNTTDFTDPVTILYGHRRDDGTMFGKLQDYYASGNFSIMPRDVYIVLPDAILHYQVFAAVEFDNTHLLHAYDFEDEETFTAFIAALQQINSDISGYDVSTEVSSGDHLLILSTCLKYNAQRRYLIVSKLLES